MTSEVAAGKSTGRDAHRRQTLRYIILPMVAVVAFVLVGVVMVLLLPKPEQVSLISDWLCTVLFLCPAVICLFPIVIGLIAAIAGMNKVHAAASGPMGQLEDLSETVVARTNQITSPLIAKRRM